MKRVLWSAVVGVLFSCIGGRGSDRPPGQGALSASSGSEDVSSAVCIADECTGAVSVGDATWLDLQPEHDVWVCRSPGNRPSSSPDPCAAEPLPPVLAHFSPGDWPSSSPEPACFLQSPTLPWPETKSLEPMEVLQSALASPPCGLGIQTTCQSRDIRVGVYHTRLLNLGTEAWADAYYDNPEQPGCRWGDSITVPWEYGTYAITPWAKGYTLDNDQENRFVLPWYYLEFYDCGTSSYCGTGSQSVETTSPCNGGGTFLDDHALVHSATDDLGMSVQTSYLGGCGNIVIARPSCASSSNSGCVRWYWFHIQATNDNFWGYDRVAHDYGCIRVRWCGGQGCPP